MFLSKKAKQALKEIVQWNKDYVVTVKHVSFVKDIAYQSADGIDVQFVKKPADHVVILMAIRKKWRCQVK